MRRTPNREYLRPIVQRVANHEAGHHVIGRLHGFEAQDCTVTILNVNGAYRGEAGTRLARPLTSTDEVVIYLQHRVQVLYAGALAESLTQLGRVDNDKALDSIRTRSTDDHSKARELVHIIRNIRHPKSKSTDQMQSQLDSIDLEMWSAATQSVEAEYKIIQGLSNRLMQALLDVDVGTEAKLTVSQIAALPGIIERFGDSQRAPDP